MKSISIKAIQLSVNSGTVALHITLTLAGVKLGDEVISTALTAEPTNVAIKMKTIFLAYRDWSLRVFPTVKKHPRLPEIVLCKTRAELLKLNLDYYDLIISCGVKN